MKSLVIMSEPEIYLKKVTNSDSRFLYELLKNRDPHANISHKNMPSYSTHLKFIKSNPYSKWYIIQIGRKKIGSIYLSKDNEIGIFLKNDFQSKDVGTTALKQIMMKNPRQRYLANISPKNKKYIQFFKQNQFKLIQYTYELPIE